MKKYLPFLLFLFPSCILAQQVYNDFEPGGIKLHSFGHYNGTLDSSFANTEKNGINTSEHCAKYTRNKDVFWDVIHLMMFDKLQNVTAYASNDPGVPKIKMKMMSTAPPGTFIELQLGRQDDDNYPSGVHSHYRAITSVQGEWEELVFEFLEEPNGSLTGPEDIDRVTLLIEPESFNGDVYYIDDIEGPEVVSVGIASYEVKKITLGQSYPNPARGEVKIDFELKQAENVELSLFDMSGRKVITLAEGQFGFGPHTVKAGLKGLPAGTYFYRLQSGNNVETMKLMVLPEN